MELKEIEKKALELLAEDKTYREVGREIGRSRTWVLNLTKKIKNNGEENHSGGIDK